MGSLPLVRRHPTRRSFIQSSGVRGFVNNDPRVRLRNVLASQLVSRILQTTVIAKPHDLSILGVGAKEGMPLLYRALYRPRNATLILVQCRQIETLPRKCYAHTSSLLKFGPKLQLKKKSTVGNRHRRVFFGGDIVKFDCDACQCARAQIPAKQALKSSILRLRKQQLMVRLEGMRKRCCEKN